MAQSIAEKLRIREGDRLFLFNAPQGFEKRLGPLPAGAKIVTAASEATHLHWFVTTSAQVNKEWTRVGRLLREKVLLWTYCPKSTSGMQTDLSRDKGWEAMTSATNLQWFNLVSFDDTWSAFGARVETEVDREKEKKPKKVREIFDWIDSEKKIVRVPEDLGAALVGRTRESCRADARPLFRRLRSRCFRASVPV